MTPLLCGLCLSASAACADARKPNIIVIMGDDIGMWNIGAYHRGLMAGRTPNIDKLAAEGAIFTDYYAEANCAAGRANFITGELPIRTGMTTVYGELIIKLLREADRALGSEYAVGASADPSWQSRVGKCLLNMGSVVITGADASIVVGAHLVREQASRLNLLLHKIY